MAISTHIKNGPFRCTRIGVGSHDNEHMRRVAWKRVNGRLVRVAWTPTAADLALIEVKKGGGM